MICSCNKCKCRDTCVSSFCVELYKMMMQMKAWKARIYKHEYRIYFSYEIKDLKPAVVT